MANNDNYYEDNNSHSTFTNSMIKTGILALAAAGIGYLLKDSRNRTKAKEMLHKVKAESYKVKDKAQELVQNTTQKGHDKAVM